MYRVVRYFEDLQDNSHAYNVGDTFPREGMAVSEERLAELASNRNKQHTILIELVDETPQETFDEESLSDMTRTEILSLADRRGYKITKLRKADVIEQFLEQQR